MSDTKKDIRTMVKALCKERKLTFEELLKEPDLELTDEDVANLREIMEEDE